MSSVRSLPAMKPDPNELVLTRMPFKALCVVPQRARTADTSPCLHTFRLDDDLPALDAM